MAVTSFAKNFSVPKEKSKKFVDDMTNDAQQISLKNFASKNLKMLLKNYCEEKHEKMIFLTQQNC